MNLAARPYRDYRPLYAVIVVLSLAIAFLMLNNIDTYYRYVRETETTRQEIATIESRIKQEQSRAEAARTQIAAIDLEQLATQTHFINAQLAERAFSWSELLDRLEEVVPLNVRIISIAPTFSDEGVVTLRLVCEAKSAEAMVATMDRFQASPHFANPFPSTDQVTPGGHRFDLAVNYRPSIPRMVSRR